MKPEIKKRWVEALRSGEYQQGNHTLRPEENRFCCLGVLTDLYCKEKGIAWDYGSEVADPKDEFLSDAVVEWAGTPDEDPDLVVDYFGEPRETTLSNINDGSFNYPKLFFVTIADLIENQL